MKTIAIIDYGVGNIRSVSQAVLSQTTKGGHDHVIVTNDHQRIRQASRIIFPGVGAIGYCMQKLDELGLADLLRELDQKIPILGICVGMQALFSYNQESGGVPCLDIFNGEVIRFDANAIKKIPHIGWNQVAHTNNALFGNIANNAYFYFVHSYFPNTNTQAIATTEYSSTFHCAFASGSTFGVQFHPEKSHKNGLQLLNNFIHNNW